MDDGRLGMSVSWGDYDQDGLMDVYVSNMFSAAGNRIVAQAQFQPAADAVATRALRGMRPAAIPCFVIAATAPFETSARQANVTMGRWAWGSLFADINNDGWEDLLVANGFVTRENTGDL